jgi:hypothetical protein
MNSKVKVDIKSLSEWPVELTNIKMSRKILIAGCYKEFERNLSSGCALLKADG